MLRPTLAVITFSHLKIIDCDDVQILSEDILDLVKFDNVMSKFENMSGAILSRNKKSKFMG